MRTTTNTANVAHPTSSNGGGTNFFVLDTQGNVIFNSYFKYTFSQVFLDGYGGIVFSTCIILMLYLFIKVVTKCLKNENSKIRAVLIKISLFIERSLITTILVSRYMYLCSSLVFNYAFLPLNGTYEQISFVFAILYTILLIIIFGLAICAAFYHSRASKVKLKRIRPFLIILTILLQKYNNKQVIGRFFTFWIFLSDFMIILVLIFLSKWPIAQLSILVIVSVTTLILSLTNSVFKTTASKILTIGTELGFISLYILFLVMYTMGNLGTSSAYSILLVLSWSAVATNASIILFWIIVEVVEFFRLRREKKRQEHQKKAAQTLRQLEDVGRRTEQRINLNATQDSQLVGLRDIPRMERSRRQLWKYSESDRHNVNRNQWTERVTNTHDSKLDQLQNIQKMERSSRQLKECERVMPNVNGSGGPSLTDSRLNKDVGLKIKYTNSK